MGDQYETVASLIKTGASIFCYGTIIQSPGKGQLIEMSASHVTVLGECFDSSSYPLSKKKHSLEHLRGFMHLRPRSRVIGAVARIRNALAFATHKFYNERNFLYIHTPILTTSDCEGAGEMFQVTTLLGKAKDNPYHIRVNDKKVVDYKKDFFKQPTYLSVSGQLNVEAYACSLSNVYTFGPTFRAEESHTTRHLAEFWMVEPEIAFADLTENMNVAEAYIKYILAYVVEKCPDDLEFLEKFEEDELKASQVKGKQAKGKQVKGQVKIETEFKKLRERLQNTIEESFQRLTYTEAIEILTKSGVEFAEAPQWGIDLGSEHERYLAEVIYKKPVILSNYPKEIKAFYMRLNEDEKTVAAMDILVPGIGELVGGSQREERLDFLEKAMQARGLEPESYSFYLDLRKFGSIPHSGFGLGFERMVRYATGIDNIRDVIPFPRYPGHCEY